VHLPPKRKNKRSTTVEKASSLVILKMIKSFFNMIYVDWSFYNGYKKYAAINT